MEIIQGKQTLFIDHATLAEKLRGYQNILIDMGTGDGRFVQHVAKTWPGYFALGLDACRENLRQVSRQTPPNALYLIANARTLPDELGGLATHLTINFPWGSLLAGLLAGEEGLMGGLAALARPGALLNVRLNGGALAEAGWPLVEGTAQVRRRLFEAGFDMAEPGWMDAADLRGFPTTWARRLAFGRDPRAMTLSGYVSRLGRGCRLQIGGIAASAWSAPAGSGRR
jgi:16S rRNA (adenine(1408)-N(1))-methyltransferase